MSMNWIKLAFAVAFGMATTAVAIPEPEAFAANGCSANCAHGSCSTNNSAKDCGCCGDGTPYCGTAGDCKSHATSVLTTVAFDIVSIGGVKSATALIDALSTSLDKSPESSVLIDAVYWYSTAVLSGNPDEIEAAQEYVNDSYTVLPDGQALVALRVTLNGMASPPAPPAPPVP